LARLLLWELSAAAFRRAEPASKGAFMQSIRFVFAPILAALVLAACTDVDEAQRAVDPAVSEVGFHFLIIQRSATLVDARHELDRHADAIDSKVLSIRSRLDDLDESCEADRNDARSAVSALEARVHVYLEEAKHMPDVVTWRSLSTTYLADMDDLFEILRGDRDDLRCDR
jgi:hypothetical protein